MSIVWGGRGRVRKRGKKNIDKDYLKVKFNGVKCNNAEIKGTIKDGDVVVVHTRKATATGSRRSLLTSGGRRDPCGLR